MSSGRGGNAGDRVGVHVYREQRAIAPRRIRYAAKSKRE
jgi:hypothetical protein